MFYTSQSPLSLLCGRFNRERSKRTIIADVVVNTVIGALEVNIERYQREAAGKDEDEKLAIEREGMLAELFKIYQWRMLLFATARRQPGPGMHGVWGDLVKVKLIPQQKVPLFTSLENFLSTINLMDRFKPPKPAYEGDAPRPDPPPVVPHDAVQFELPALQYPPHERGVLTLKKLAGFKFFDLSKWNANKVVWKKCMFYDFETTVNKPISIPVFRNVNFEEWEQVFGKLAVLIPLENLRKGLKTGDPWEREDRLRCVVLSHFGNVSELGYPADTGPGLAGLFVGIVDLEGSPGREEGNVELADDVTLY